MNNIVDHVAEEIKKYNGIAFPVKSSLLRRFFVRRTKWQNLHPNPDDEFSDPKIGPSQRIIREYEEKFRRFQQTQGIRREDKIEPIIVERMHPDGYMIINGHHRWAACAMMDMKCNVSIVNLTQKNDIINMLEKSTNYKRVSLDLDEVVFCESKEGYEKELGFPRSLFFKERIRAGIPALFYYLKNHGYDIWVYSSNYYSYDTISRLLKWYHARVDGVVTGMQVLSRQEGSSNIKKALAEKYKFTLNITDSSVIKIFSNSDDFEEKEINQDDSNWSAQILNILKELDEKE